MRRRQRSTCIPETRQALASVRVRLLSVSEHKAAAFSPALGGLSHMMESLLQAVSKPLQGPRFIGSTWGFETRSRNCPVRWGLTEPRTSNGHPFSNSLASFEHASVPQTGHSLRVGRMHYLRELNKSIRVVPPGHGGTPETANHAREDRHTLREASGANRRDRDEAHVRSQATGPVEAFCLVSEPVARLC